LTNPSAALEILPVPFGVSAKSTLVSSPTALTSEAAPDAPGFNWMPLPACSLSPHTSSAPKCV